MDWIGNSNSIYKTLGASNHTENEREQDDYYATDPIAITKLLAVESLNRKVWECAAGAGHLSEHLKKHGWQVYSTDIKNRGYILNAVQDFLTATQEQIPFKGKYDILTNPPYKYAKEFVIKALELLPEGCKCFMFLKLTFLEGKARFNQLFAKTPPKAVHVFSERVICAKNGDFQRMKDGGGSAVAYAWFVWEKGYTDQTIINWI